jgi:hypothetical protein
VGEVWNDLVGNVGQNSNILCSNNQTVPVLTSTFVDEPPSPEADDIQMSTSTWYEPEKDSEFFTSRLQSSRSCPTLIIKGIVITSLDDDEYDGDDEAQQQQRTKTKSSAQEPEFTISPAFLNAINKKLTRPVDRPPTPPSSDAPTTQALVLFRPLPPFRSSFAGEGEIDVSSHKEGVLDSLMPKPSFPTPSGPSLFYVQDAEQPSFVFKDDDMEIEML